MMHKYQGESPPTSTADLHRLGSPAGAGTWDPSQQSLVAKKRKAEMLVYTGWGRRERICRELSVRWCWEMVLWSCFPGAADRHLIP